MTPNEDEYQELRIGLSWYITGQFPAVPYETARRIADGMVEGMLRAVREAEREIKMEAMLDAVREAERKARDESA